MQGPALRTIVAAIWGMLSATPAFAQNMVLNGGLEEFTGCPDQSSQTNRAHFWTQPTGGTSDYFNACDTQVDPILLRPIVGVPLNVAGQQTAFEGVAYGGIGVYWEKVEYREYL